MWQCICLSCLWLHLIWNSSSTLFLSFMALTCSLPMYLYIIYSSPISISVQITTYSSSSLQGCIVRTMYLKKKGSYLIARNKDLLSFVSIIDGRLFQEYVYLQKNKNNQSLIFIRTQKDTASPHQDVVCQWEKDSKQ